MANADDDDQHEEEEDAHVTAGAGSEDAIKKLPPQKNDNNVKKRQPESDVASVAAAASSSSSEEEEEMETDVLASLQASLQDQNVYEEQVIRQATHQLAPSLAWKNIDNALDFEDGNDVVVTTSRHGGFPKLLLGIAPSFSSYQSPPLPRRGRVTQQQSRPPSQQQQRPTAGEGYPALMGDVPHLKTTMHQVRRDQEREPHVDMHFVKEQMLVHVLGEILAGGGKSALSDPQSKTKTKATTTAAGKEKRGNDDDDDRGDWGGAFLQRPPREEAAMEETRRRLLWQQQQPLDDDPRKPAARDLRRVPLMKRKRLAQDQAMVASAASVRRRRRDDDDQEDEETEERRAQLKRLRQQRKKRRLERRDMLQLDGDGSSSSSEEEVEMDDSPEVEKEIVANNAEETSTDRKAESETTETNDAELKVQCPLCSAFVVYDDSANMDEALSQHMDDCQRRGRSRRRRAASTFASSSRNDSDNHDDNYGDDQNGVTKAPPKTSRQRNKLSKAKNKKHTIPMVYPSRSLDDLEESAYEDRVDDWIEHGLDRMKKMKELDDTLQPPGEEDYGHGLWVPAWINDRLFGYQRHSLRWIWSLHLHQSGGILGDEMGLGKTVSCCSALGVLAANRKLKSVLILAPATMLQHWVSELGVWAPGIRRILIHPSGEVDGISRVISSKLLRALAKWLKRVRQDRVNECIDDEDRQAQPAHSFCGTAYAIVTTYENVRRNPDVFTQHEWSYVCMDECQKIRNPDADVTLVCKRLRTPHRLALSGTPIQNDLRELWSLVDWIHPGLLGTLPAFEKEFADPIKRGAYANASPMQVQMAYRCAVVLRDLVKPHLLRRLKNEVAEVSRMPGKTEHVLFCRLSDTQRALYETYLRSDEVAKVVRGSVQLLSAITMLRKICNHPDLVTDGTTGSVESLIKNGFCNSGPPNDNDDSDFEDGYDDELLTERSGKLEVLSKILPLWKKQGHRVLIFCQWRKMLNVIQRFVMLQGWKFGRLDGNTNVAARQRLVDTFNSDTSYFGLLCTTRTGGVGLNLTGANRIILYDPDWNPSTDAQARERAWRFGQEREVTIYRLITAGTVEEKIYQRQIFKTAMSNKILQDPRQRRLFSQKDLRDLFTLKADSGSFRSGAQGMTETSQVTRGGGVIEDTAKADKDNETTLKTVMRSKGLAGVFDHQFVEEDSTRKSASAREMEEKAKKVASRAAKALRQSVASEDSFVPTWTGSMETEPRRFGSVDASLPGRPSSSSLLASIKEREVAIKTDGGNGGPLPHSELLDKIKRFVQRRRPTTDQILNEFDNMTDDVSAFRRLLKSVASIHDGRWYLLD